MEKPKYLKVQNTDLVRDTNSKAILVTDHAQYNLFKKKRERELRLLEIEAKLDKVLKLIGDE